MVELLIKNGSSESAREGQIVYVAKNKHLWGRYESKTQWLLEGNPESQWTNQFFVIKITDTTKIEFDNAVNISTHGMRVDLNSLPIQTLLELRSLGEASIMLSVILPLLRGV